MVEGQEEDPSLTIRYCQYVEDLSIASLQVVLGVEVAAEGLFLAGHCSCRLQNFPESLQRGPRLLSFAQCIP